MKGWALGATALIVAGVAACAKEEQAAPAARPLPRGVTWEMVAKGQALFNGAANCSGCHGRDGGGGFLAPRLSDREHLHLQTSSYGEILERIRSGVPQPKRHPGPMPPKGGADLSEEQLREVAAFVHHLDPGGQ
ncbi:MAG: glucose/sorbosone dehydrogenase-like protein [Akkermansiaceae bacterium]|nr:glucose/sorbosone dehydrogenase-like protein [Akkermansiaceae bacterium]